MSKEVYTVFWVYIVSWVIKLNKLNRLKKLYAWNGFRNLNRSRLLLLVLSYMLFCCSPVFADGPSAWLNINDTNTEQFENGEKTGASSSLFQNYYFNFNKSINPLLSYQFYIRTTWSDSSSEDSQGIKTYSYQRAIEPALDIYFRNPIYGLDAGYRRLEQWPTEHIKENSRRTTEFYYSRFNLTPPELPSLSLQFDRQSNYDHLLIKQLDNTLTRYSANSVYSLLYKGLNLGYNFTYTRNENETPLSQVLTKTIDDTFNLSYNIAYNKSFWDNRVSLSAGYQGNYVNNESEQYATQTGNVPFKRTPFVGWYAKGILAQPEVYTLTTSDPNLINTPTNALSDDPGYTTATGVNIGNNGDAYYNIGIQLSFPQDVDTLYIYVKSAAGNPGNITWDVYRSPTNGPGPWTNITSGLNVTPTVFNPQNNIYRYELKFTSFNALYFKAVNMTKLGLNDVFVTEIEAFGTEVVSSSGKVTSSSTFFTQGINLNGSVRPVNNLIFSLNYFLNRADQHPKSIIDSIEGAFSNLLSKDTTGYGEELRSNITRTYGGNVTWIPHRLLTATASFQRNEAFDNQYVTAFHADTYSLNFTSSPLPTLNTNLSLVRTYSYSFNEKQSMNDLYLLTIGSRLYKDVNMITDVGYTQGRTYAMPESSATLATENTKSSTRYIRGTIDANLTPNLYTDLTYGFSSTSGSTSSSLNEGAVIITYRPGQFVNITGTLRVSDANGDASTAEGFSIDWLVLPVIRLNLNYQHTDTEPGSTTNDSITSYARWYITKFLDLQLTYSYVRNVSDKTDETYNFGGNLTCRFW
jgi:hypothetical protein